MGENFFQDYRDQAPDIPLPDDPNGPTDWECFAAGVREIRASAWGDMRAWWARNNRDLWHTIRGASFFLAVIMGGVALFVADQGRPPGVGYYSLLAILTPLGLHGFCELVFRTCVEAGREVLHKK